jgi:hypothetical protein
MTDGTRVTGVLDWTNARAPVTLAPTLRAPSRSCAWT